MEFTATILRNKGVPVTMLVLGEDGLPTYDAEGNEVTEEVYLRFDNNVLADIEDHFGSLGEYDVALNTKTLSAIRVTLGIALGGDGRAWSARLPLGSILEATAAVQTALAMATGMDPTPAADLYRSALASVAEGKVAMVAEVLGQTPAVTAPASSRRGKPKNGATASARGTLTPVR